MFGEIETLEGKIVIDSEVIAKLAGIVGMGCYGVVGMAVKNVKDGFVRLLGMDALSTGVIVDIVDNRISISLHIIVEYGTNISAIAESLMSTVKYKVEQVTGLVVNNVNVIVEGMKI